MALGPRYVLGLGLIVLVACIWVSASQLIQFIYNTNFDKPIFLTYFNTANFSFLLLGFTCVPSWRAMPWYPLGQPGQFHTLDDSEESSTSMQAEDDPPSSPDGTVLVLGGGGEEGARPRDVYAVRDVFQKALLFAPFWCGANVAFNLSLSLTSVASNTILSTTSSMFVFILGLLFLRQPFDALKLLAVLITISGATLVALSDSSAGVNHSFYGDAFALVGAMLYGAYVSLLSESVTNEESFPMAMFFGFVGTIILVTCWPVLILLHFTGTEPFEMPSMHTISFLLINSWVGTNLSDVLWAQSVLLTSPLTATLGLSLTIPLALLSDALLRSSRLSPWYVCGALLVVVGFALVNTAELLRRPPPPDGPVDPAEVAECTASAEPCPA